MAGEAIAVGKEPAGVAFTHKIRHAGGQAGKWYDEAFHEKTGGGFL